MYEKSQVAVLSFFLKYRHLHVARVPVIRKKPSREGRMSTHITFGALALMALLLASGSVESAIYKWVDKDGKTHFSDSPPHSGAQEITPKQGPLDDEVREARERLERTLRRLKRKDDIRQERREKERQRKAAAEQQEARNQSRCRLLQQNLYVLLQQRPVYNINKKGERIYLNDETRNSEVKRVQKMIANYCQQYQ